MGVGQVKAIGQSLLRWGLLLILGGYCLAASAQASEAGLRVAFVYNFIKFIEWPALPDSELSLCVLGAEDETRSALAPIDKKVQQNRSIHVIYMDHISQTNEPDLAQAFSHCELLYVTEVGAAMPLPQILQPGMLLVVDEASPTDERVGIALMRTIDNRIEFQINESAINHAGVKISSQLLRLAKKRQGGRG